MSDDTIPLSEFWGLERGDVYRGKTVLSLTSTSGGGVGMGTYPSTKTVTFSDGSVYHGDQWVPTATCIQGPSVPLPPLGSERPDWVCPSVPAELQSSPLNPEEESMLETEVLDEVTRATGGERTEKTYEITEGIMASVRTAIHRRLLQEKKA